MTRGAGYGASMAEHVANLRGTMGHTTRMAIASGRTMMNNRDFTDLTVAIGALIAATVIVAGLWLWIVAASIVAGWL